jgi:hypothetical protein
MPRISALRSALACAAVIGGTAACNDYLTVSNPGAQPIEGIADPANLALLVNGAVGEFQGAVDTLAVYGAVLSDEAVAAHANNSYRDLDRREFTNALDLDAIVYRRAARARFAADTTALILRAALGDSAGTDVRLARVLALSGYSRVYLAETFCDAPIDVSRPFTPDELFQQAVAKFDTAATVAAAAKAANRGGSAADTLLNLALVGAARASLGMNKRPEAIAYANRVGANFVYRSFYNEGIPVPAGLPQNHFWNATGAPGTPGLAASNASNGVAFSSAALWLIVGPTFQGLNDPRMPITATMVNTMSTAAGLSRGFVPFKPASFGGTGTPTPITPGTSIRVASTLEAQYIAAEASGGDAAALAFVNLQRTRNGLAPSTATTPAAILADLRDQRRREFFLDGHRLGDIRRYKAQYGVDFFPTGPYLGSAATPYGSAECFPIPISEVNTNPNVPNG